MKVNDKVRFVRGRHAGETWFVNHVEVAYWSDDDGVRHAEYDVSVVPSVGATVAKVARFEDLEVI